MLVLALVTVYLACGAVLLAALAQDRSKRPSRRAGDPHARGDQAREWVIRTQF